MTKTFNSPPGWPTPPLGWTPPTGWRPDPAWPEPPPGWELWIDGADTDDETDSFYAGRHQTRPSSDAAATPTDQGSVGPITASLVPEALAPTAEPDDPAALRAQIQALREELKAVRLSSPALVVDDQDALQEVGIYQYHHPLEDAAAYRNRLDELSEQIRRSVRDRSAVQAADMFTWNGSLAKGRRMVADLSKLMLRAYNAEADNCVRSLRAGNLAAAKKRLEASVTAVAKLGSMMEMHIDPEYHSLRLAELELVADYQMKLQQEREDARQQRELLREQQRAEKELAAERERLDKEREHYVTVLESLRATGDDSAADSLSQRLSDIDHAIAANDYRIANIRAGYVYVISNIGAFGPNVVKIGMTRRLEPLDRVRELGDASVPFRYDVHALFFSDDAIALEADLHRTFAARRVNHVNERREFFFASPSDVRDALAEKVGGLLSFTEQPEALEYFQSRARWPNFAIAASPPSREDALRYRDPGRDESIE